MLELKHLREGGCPHFQNCSQSHHAGIETGVVYGYGKCQTSPNRTMLELKHSNSQLRKIMRNAPNRTMLELKRY